mmetsp:Transcript_45947/g.141518  ORF Transcript_45947/g.141518 Transcript_45947/m.141518 type:complete len:263 (-) Transcript_45947:1407-2195(-)
MAIFALDTALPDVSSNWSCFFPLRSRGFISKRRATERTMCWSWSMVHFATLTVIACELARTTEARVGDVTSTGVSSSSWFCGDLLRLRCSEFDGSSTATLPRRERATPAGRLLFLRGSGGGAGVSVASDGFSVALVTSRSIGPIRPNSSTWSVASPPMSVIFRCVSVPNSVVSGSDTAASAHTHSGGLKRGTVTVFCWNSISVGSSSACTAMTVLSSPSSSPCALRYSMCTSRGFGSGESLLLQKVNPRSTPLSCFTVILDE